MLSGMIEVIVNGLFFLPKHCNYLNVRVNNNRRLFQLIISKSSCFVNFCMLTNLLFNYFSKINGASKSDFPLKEQKHLHNGV